MLNRNKLIESVGEEYTDMIKKISIPDFTKCIAQYSGLRIQDVKDDVIEEYLSLWCKNKKYLFDLFGGTRVDMPIVYKEEGTDYQSRLRNIGKDFPLYYPWLTMFDRQRQNKINDYDMFYGDRDTIADLFPNYSISNVSLTHFFKNKLNAPDELVTAIGKVWENEEINATYTLSIDPVDIMLSSENPYNWTSCYRLEQFNESHADGCLAGVIDESTVTSYIWNKQGDFSLYGKYDFKNIRYKKARITLAFNKTLNAIHFNNVYPWKSECSDGFKKMIRNKVETYICEKTGKTNIWRTYNYSKDNLYPERRHPQYGYDEYDDDYVWVLKDDKNYDKFQIFNEAITCPCGCGDIYEGSDDRDEDIYYNGEGHINDNWYYEESDEEYCECADDWISCDHDCENCQFYINYYKDNNED